MLLLTRGNPIKSETSRMPTGLCVCLAKCSLSEGLDLYGSLLELVVFPFTVTKVQLAL